MPLIDMPLDELKGYRGCSPKPVDFDAYWERALLELDGNGLEYSLERDDFSAPGVECFHLWFTGTGGARIHARFIAPVNRNGKIPAVVFFHGYRGHCGDWFSKLPYAMSGMCAVMMDVRGQAGLSEDTALVCGDTVEGHIIQGVDEKNPDKLFFRNVFLDTAQLVRVLQRMDFIDGARIGATGSSQGGALTLACASLVPELKVACAAVPFLIDYKRLWEMDLMKDAYNEFNRYFRLKDPQHKREEEFWTRLGYIDLQYLVPRIRAKTVFFTGLMDTVCPPSTQFAAYNKITAKKSMVLYPEYGHETLPEFDEQVYQIMLTAL